MANFLWGSGGAKLTPEEIALQRSVLARRKAQGVDVSPIGSPLQGIARVLDALGDRYQEGQLNESAAANESDTQALIAKALGGVSPVGQANTDSGSISSSLQNVTPTSGFSVDPTIKDGIAQTAAALGIDPVDLATTISYETGGTFDPTKAGPTTQWGQHKGLIQFGEPQAKQYGVNWEDPIGSQLGPQGAIAKYLTDTGVKPGMGLMDIYSAVNAGGVGRYNRSDANNGGAPGTVADKVNQQMGGHRANALALFGSAAPADQSAAAPIQMAQAAPAHNQLGISPEVMQLLTGSNVTPQGKAIAQMLATQQQGQASQQQKQALAEQQRQQEIARRQAIAQQTGINPSYAQDDDIWKAAAGNIFAAPSTSTVGANVIDNRTGQPIYQGTPEAPTSVREFEYGQNNPEYFTRQEALRRSGAPTTEGAIPAGYQANRDANGRVISVSPLAGSPAAFDEAQRGKATDKQAGQRSTSTDVVTNAGVRALQAVNGSGMPATGTAGRLMSMIPESNAAEVRRQVATLKANASASSIQAMRDASPTGAALGGTSDKDVELLANKAGTLDPDSPNFERDLKDVVKTQLELIHGPEAGRKIFDDIDWNQNSNVPTDLPGVTIKRKGQ